MQLNRTVDRTIIMCTALFMFCIPLELNIVILWVP